MEWLRTPLVVDDRNGPLSPPASTTTKKPSSAHRLMAFDFVRGLIMIIMAWDHSLDQISDRTLPRDKGSEMWTGELSTYDNNTGLFFARFISHFCAPGFFFLMGVGMAYFHISRQKQFAGNVWSHRRIVKHFVIRGALLLLMDRIVNIPSYASETGRWKGGYPFLGSKSVRGLISIFEVLTALGFVMILVGLLLPILAWMTKRWKYRKNGITYLTGGQLCAGFLAFISFMISNIVVVHYQSTVDIAISTPFPRAGAMPENFGGYITRFLVLPGIFPQGVIAYPIIPWIGLTLLGLCYGYYLIQPHSVGKGMIQASSLTLSISCFIFFLIIRFFGGAFGNYRGWPRGYVGEPGEGRSESNWFVSFMDVCKYPPSLAYALITMSGVLAMILVFERIVLGIQTGIVRRRKELEQKRIKAQWIEHTKNKMSLSSGNGSNGNGNGHHHHSSSLSSAASPTQHNQRLSNGYGSHDTGLMNPASAAYGQQEQHIVTEADFAPLPSPSQHSHSSSSSSDTMHPAFVSSSPDITVNMVRPSMGDQAELERIAQQQQQQGQSADGDSSSTPSSSRILTYLTLTYNPQPTWPLPARMFLVPLLIFGRVPLFYYVIHWYVLMIGSLFFHGISDGVYLPYLPMWWGFLITVMYGISAPYARFKESKGTESLWRFL